ncbi:hypothetical protein ACA910_000468 [Epithemia clementina (nom. ined.)]
MRRVSSTARAGRLRKAKQFERSERKQPEKSKKERKPPEVHEILGVAIADALGVIQTVLCNSCDLAIFGFSSDPTKPGITVNEIEVPVSKRSGNQDSPTAVQSVDEVSCLTESPEYHSLNRPVGSPHSAVHSPKESPGTPNELQNPATVLSERHPKQQMRHQLGGIPDNSRMKLATLPEGDSTMETTQCSDLRSTRSSSPDGEFRRGSLDNYGHAQDVRIQWAIQKNILPGLDRWKGILRSANTESGDWTAASIDSTAVGLVQGFWIRRHPQKKSDNGKVKPSWGPTEVVDLAALHQVNATLGHFWQTTLQRGWPAKPALKEKPSEDGNDKENCSNSPIKGGQDTLEDKENAGGNNLAVTESTSCLGSTTDECCLISHVWIVPQHRGNGWGLTLADKASRVIPRRYNKRREEQLQAKSSLSFSSNDGFPGKACDGQNVQVVMALPPYNKQLRSYFGGDGTGWSTCWDDDFLIK